VKILLIHQNFPGQFRGLAPALIAAGHDLRAVSARAENFLAGVHNTRYVTSRSTTASIHPWLMNTETAVIRGEAVSKVVQKMASEGWTPDVVLGHTGWGEMLFMRQLLPHARLIGFNELYYQTEGGNMDFDPEFPADPVANQRLAVRNMHLMSSLLACDVGITPTHWQASRFPSLLRQKLAVVHDGILTDQLQPDPTAWVSLNRDGLRLSHGDEVVTFINRNLEPMRGYHQFMRALPQILKQRPNAHVVIVGGDGVSYGSPAPEGSTYKQIYLNEVHSDLDMSRVHFVSRVPYNVLLSLLRISAAHVYLTMPFVLSWSLLEAMSVGALVIGSDTAPVREVIEHNKNGLLVNYFDPRHIADTVCDVLAHPQQHAHLRVAARQTVVERYDFETQSLPAYMALIEGRKNNL
jgi:glycosyltransferase involved in cell wall biosynthesis